MALKRIYCLSQHLQWNFQYFFLLMQTVLEVIDSDELTVEVQINLEYMLALNGVSNINLFKLGVKCQNDKNDLNIHEIK